MKKDDKVELKKEQKDRLISEIQGFFIDQRGEEIGNLQTEMLLDLLIDKVGGEIYNKALYDAWAWFRGRFDDLEADFYSLEKK